MFGVSNNGGIHDAGGWYPSRGKLCTCKYVESCVAVDCESLHKPILLDSGWFPKASRPFRAQKSANHVPGCGAQKSSKKVYFLAIRSFIIYK